MSKRALSILDSIAAAQSRALTTPFVAPFVGNQKVVLRISGLVKRLSVTAPNPGWWKFQPTDDKTASAVEPLDAIDRSEFLKHFPAIRVVMLEQLDDYRWLAVPFNVGDLRQRYPATTLPMLVHFPEAVAAFDRVVVRLDGAVFFDTPDDRADAMVADDLRGALEAGHETPPGQLSDGEKLAFELLRRRSQQRIEEEQRLHLAREMEAVAERRSQQLRTREGRVRDALDRAGAKFLSYRVISSTMLQVTWRHAGSEHTANVSTNLEVVSAGLCLSGHDRVFDLTTLVNVVANAPQFALSYGRLHATDDED